MLVNKSLLIQDITQMSRKLTPNILLGTSKASQLIIIFEKTHLPLLRFSIVIRYELGKHSSAWAGGQKTVKVGLYGGILYIVAVHVFSALQIIN